MIKSLQGRLKEKQINLIVELSAQAFLTDEGYDPLYGARPLRRAIMKYLEDTLAEQCLSKTLYPDTKIIVRRKKVEGTLMTYTNELEVEIDFSDVDPNLLTSTEDTNISVNKTEEIGTKSEDVNSPNSNVDYNKPTLDLGKDQPETVRAGRADQFLIKK